MRPRQGRTKNRATAQSFPRAGATTTRAGGVRGAQKPEAPTNWAQARGQIDRGETGDRIAVTDPAAAPLGTDTEAGGASTPAEDIARSVRLQRNGEDARAAAQAPLAAGRRQLAPWLVVILALAIAVVVALVVAG